MLKDKLKVGYRIQSVFEFIKRTGEFENIKTSQHSKLLNNNLDIKSERVYELLGSRMRIYLLHKNRYNLKITE